MKLYFYRRENPNFGDELNTWLLPKVFPDFFDDDERTLFLGIGSILFDHHPKDSQKVVFGSGYGGYTPIPKLDEKWTVHCVRGPRTASVFGLDPKKAVGDTAILLNRYRKRGMAPNSYRASFIPHFESINRGHWQNACDLAGIHFIDPRRPVEEILTEIEASSVVIAEAMHGAIVSDALRVPWIPVLPLHAIHRMKWFDWAEALDLSLSPRPLWPSSLQEAFMLYKQRQSSKIENAQGATALGIHWADKALTSVAAMRLWNLSRSEPMLSRDASLNRVIDKLETHAREIQKIFIE